jgi:L-malate glycosyltransferase
MKILLAGPALTSAIRASTGLALEGAPPATAQTPIAALAGALLQMGHEIGVLTLDPSVDDVVRIREGPLTTIFAPLRGPPRYRARTRMLTLFEAEIRHLEREMTLFAPDIVHAHWTYEYAEAAVRSRLPHLVTMHDLGWECLWQFRDAYRALRLLMKFRVMPRVRALSVVAPFMHPKARQYGYFGPVDVVPNGIEVLEPDPATIRAKMDRPLRIITIGNTSRLKNVGAAIAAHAVLRRRIPNAELHLFGPGLDESFARGAAGVTGHGHAENPELRRFLADHGTILLHPTRLESFGVAILEAKMAAVPVVAATDAGGVDYVCGSDAGCTLANMSDSEAISDAIQRYVDDPAEYLRCALLANADARTRFDREQVARRYSEIYARIAGSPRQFNADDAVRRVR